MAAGSQFHASSRMTEKGRFETLPHVSKLSSPGALAQVPPADFKVPILGQLPPTHLPLGDALEAGPLEVVRLDPPLGGGPLRNRRRGQLPEPVVCG
jgi:hypothetical protein